MASPSSPTPSSRLLERVGAVHATEELREAVLAELMGEQLAIVQEVAGLAHAQRDVVALMDAVDRRLTGTLQQMRAENALLADLVGKSELAFKGELALKAAEHARREFSQAMGGALDALSPHLARLEKSQGRSRQLRAAEVITLVLATVAVTLATVGFVAWLMKGFPM